MAKQKQDDQLEHTYSSYVRIRDVTLKTGQKRWMIGRSGERESGISVLAARHDDHDDDDSLMVKNKSLPSHSVLIQPTQLSTSTDPAHTQSHVKTVSCQTIKLSVNTVTMSKTVLFEVFQFSISTLFKCKYGFIVKNISISSYSV